jgi:hypothetical protein
VSAAYGDCPVCRVECLLAKVGVCYPCDSRARWIAEHSVLPPYVMTRSHWDRLLALVGCDKSMNPWTTVN